MNTIHMQTEAVQDLSFAIKRSAEDMNDLVAEVNASINRMDWEASGSTEFKAQARQIGRKLVELVEAFDALGFKVWQRVDEWITIDQLGVGRLGDQRPHMDTISFFPYFGDSDPQELDEPQP